MRVLAVLLVVLVLAVAWAVTEVACANWVTCV